MQHQPGLQQHDARHVPTHSHGDRPRSAKRLSERDLYDTMMLLRAANCLELDRTYPLPKSDHSQRCFIFFLFSFFRSQSEKTKTD
jgi:hypothetical protein